MNSSEQDKSSPRYDGYSKYDHKVAETYDCDRDKEEIWHRENACLEQLLRGRQVSRLLDLPVGTGRLMPYYCHIAQEVIGVDISEPMLIRADTRAKEFSNSCQIRIEKGDVFALRFPDRMFDIAVVFRLLHLLPEPLLKKAVSSLCRVTSGEVIVQTYARHNAQNKSPTLIRRLVNRIKRLLGARKTVISAGKPWSHIEAYRHSQGMIDGLFRECGFASVLSMKIAQYEGDDVNVTVYSRVSQLDLAGEG